MFTNSLLAISGALLSVAAAVPMAEPHHHHHQQHKRDSVWVSHLEVVVETIAITKTVWVEPGESTGGVKHHSHGGSSSRPASSAAQTTPAIYTPPPPPAYTSQSSSSTSSTSFSTSTSIYVVPPAPTTSTSTYVAPPTDVAPPAYIAPTTPAEPPAYAEPPTYAAPAPVSTPSSAGSGSSGNSLSGMAASGKTYIGDLTWYDVGLGACGKTNVTSDPVVAIPEAIFDAYGTGNPNNNPLCGKTVTITGKDGSSYTATIVDRCPGCTQNDLDLSQDFFNNVTQHGDGRVGGMKWCFD